MVVYLRRKAVTPGIYVIGARLDCLQLTWIDSSDCRQWTSLFLRAFFQSLFFTSKYQIRHLKYQIPMNISFSARLFWTLPFSLTNTKYTIPNTKYHKRRPKYQMPMNISFSARLFPKPPYSCLNTKYAIQNTKSPWTFFFCSHFSDSLVFAQEHHTHWVLPNFFFFFNR